jgi:hypothetical protein
MVDSKIQFNGQKMKTSSLAKIAKELHSQEGGSPYQQAIMLGALALLILTFQKTVIPTAYQKEYNYKRRFIILALFGSILTTSGILEKTTVHTPVSSGIEGLQHGQKMIYDTSGEIINHVGTISDATLNTLGNKLQQLSESETTLAVKDMFDMSKLSGLNLDTYIPFTSEFSGMSKEAVEKMTNWGQSLSINPLNLFNGNGTLKEEVIDEIDKVIRDEDSKLEPEPETDLKEQEKSGPTDGIVKEIVKLPGDSQTIDGVTNMDEDGSYSPYVNDFY